MYDDVIDHCYGGTDCVDDFTDFLEFDNLSDCDRVGDFAGFSEFDNLSDCEIANIEDHLHKTFSCEKGIDRPIILMPLSDRYLTNSKKLRPFEEHVRNTCRGSFTRRTNVVLDR